MALGHTSNIFATHIQDISGPNVKIIQENVKISLGTLSLYTVINRKC
jgi:hypothetical protein